MIAGIVPLDSVLGRILSVSTLVLSLSTNLSPTPTVIKIYRRKSTEKLAAFPFFAMVLSCTTWGLYCLVTEELTCWVPNVSGAIFTFIFLVVFQIYAVKEKRNLIWGLNVAWAIILSGMFYVFSMDDQDFRVTFFSTLGITTYCIFLFSPLVTIFKVFKEKAVDYLPFDLCFVLFINCALWVFYGVLVADDFSLWGTGALGLILAGIQLTAHILYGNFTKSVKLLCCRLCIRDIHGDDIADDEYDEKNFVKNPATNTFGVGESEESSMETLEDGEIKQLEIPIGESTALNLQALTPSLVVVEDLKPSSQLSPSDSSPLEVDFGDKQAPATQTVTIV